MSRIIRNEESQAGVLVWAEEADLDAGTYRVEEDGEITEGPRALTLEERRHFFPVPESVPAWRITGLLRAQGRGAEVEAAIDALPEPQRSMAQIGMVAAEVLRTASTVVYLQSVLQLSDEEVDDLFRTAASIDV